MAVVILNWKGWRDTIECLESLRQLEFDNFDIIVIDNASPDDSLRRIRAYANGEIEVKSPFLMSAKAGTFRVLEYTRQEAELLSSVSPEFSNKRLLVLIKNYENSGFASGSNVGMRFALKTLAPDYLLLLNNDTVCDRASLATLVGVAEANARVGVVGPAVYSYSRPLKLADGLHERLNLWTADFHVLSYWELIKARSGYREVAYVNGACMLVKRRVIEEVGMFDPEYFLYWEEVDWCLRIRERGYRIIYTPSARIWHKVGGSTESPTSWYYFGRNMFLFIKKHATLSQRMTFLVFFLAVRLWVHSLVLLVAHRSLDELRAFWQGAMKGLEILLAHDSSARSIARSRPRPR